MSYAAPWTGSKRDGPVRGRVEVGRRREPDATGDGTCEVGEDVAEQVVGHHHVVARAFSTSTMQAASTWLYPVANSGVLECHRVERPLPEIARIG